MTTQLAVLNAELELLNTAYAITYDKHISKLDNIINKWIVEPNGATCIRRWFKTGFTPTELDVFIEVGFYDEENKKIDFGSDFYIDFNNITGIIRVNHGTCGYFDKTDVYQVKRLSTLAFIFNNIEAMEEELREFAATAQLDAHEHDEKRFDLQHQIYHIESSIKKTAEEAIDKKLVVGNTLEYPETTTIRPAFQLFCSPASIIKRTPKFVTCNDANNIVRRIPVSDIICSIHHTNMIVKENN